MLLHCTWHVKRICYVNCIWLRSSVRWGDMMQCGRTYFLVTVLLRTRKLIVIWNLTWACITLPINWGQMPSKPRYEVCTSTTPSIHVLVWMLKTIIYYPNMNEFTCRRAIISTMVLAFCHVWICIVRNDQYRKRTFFILTSNMYVSCFYVFDLVLELVYKKCMLALFIFIRCVLTRVQQKERKSVAMRSHARMKLLREGNQCGIL